MKKIVPSFALMLTLPFSHAAIAGGPAKGSQEAASQVVSEYLNSLYKSPSSTATPFAILAKTPDSLTVQTQFRDKVCTVKVVKNADANQFGWVAQQHQCAASGH